MRHSLTLLLTAVVLTTVAGCARKPVVHGVVTLDGVPLNNGEIQFYPEKGDAPTSAAVLDKDGSYRLEASATKFKVVVNSNKPTGKKRLKYEGDPSAGYIEEFAQALPSRYSDLKKTELFVMVEPGDNEKNFELHTDPAKKGP
jgi:hypothetical protein